MLTLARVCVFGRFETYIDLPPQLVAPVLDSGDASQGSEGVGDERRPAAVAAAAEATLDALLVAFVEKQPQWMTQLQAVRGVFTHTHLLRRQVGPHLRLQPLLEPVSERARVAAEAPHKPAGLPCVVPAWHAEG